MKFEGKHFSALGLGITAVVGLVGIYYYKHQSDKAAVENGDTSGGGFPYFQTASLPSSVTGADGSGGASGGSTGVDVNDLASMQADLQSHVSDNSLQSDWMGPLQQDTAGIIDALNKAGYGTSSLQANLSPKTGGGFNYNVMATSVIKNATTSTVPGATIVGGGSGGSPFIRLPSNMPGFYSGGGSPGDVSNDVGVGVGEAQGEGDGSTASTGSDASGGEGPGGSSDGGAGAAGSDGGGGGW